MDTAAHELRLARGRVVIARSLSLVIPAGAIVHLVGTNGSGKTSLLRLLAGVVAPRRGYVTGPPRRAYVPERIVMPQQLRVGEWIAAMARARGPGSGAGGASAMELPADLDSRPFGALSKGQVQRVVLAEALGCGAQLLAMDEPWAGLDEEGAAELDDRLLNAARAGAAVIYTNHAARSVATRRVRLARGEILEDGDAEPARASTREVRP